ncbi:tetratricopeptide repeat protein [Variovorax sp. J22R115]|uniref:tetratricopeptide repeat protein n=1 Tax=Variovorax sp. J22R115 TaxID=3053509 RepID=UPI002575C618|nr:tetratricopeptide repeat protein [Variovorax sp. J22R115]MDM0053037.1 tetratricopeptide repeat protein [Variovorax sp. J22R115]
MKSSDNIAKDAEASRVGRRRYPGVIPFEEKDSEQFHGRKAATQELLLRVMSVRLLLQFAPSGVGKTSLLNAGLFPALRPRNYFPFIVRLNQTTEGLLQAVRTSLVDAARKFGLIDPIIPEAPQSLWMLIAGTQLWSRDLILLTPVLVFDQFEEVFTLHDDGFRKVFASEVGELASGVTRIAPNAEGDAQTSNATAAPAVKIIISLREEYLGKIEEFSASIPDLFRERLRLAPLTPREAEEAIVEPARLAGDRWTSPPFEYEPECLKELIAFIDGSSASVRVIESLTLQLVCQQAETLVMQGQVRGSPAPTVAMADFGGSTGLQLLVRDYFHDVLQKLPSETSRKHARLMFAEGLLDRAGKRLMLEQGEMEEEYHLGKNELDTLEAGGLLRREPRNERVFYEICHDRIAETIAKNRKVRLPRWVMPTLAVAAVFIVVLGWSLVAITTKEKQAAAARDAAVKAQEQTERARHQVEYGLQLVLSEDMVSRLSEAGLADVLRQVLKQSDGDPSSATRGLSSALKLRHQGDIERDQGTVREARRKFDLALANVDALSTQGASTPDPTLMVERARILRRLGSLIADAGDLAQAESTYAESVRLWNSVLNGSADPQKLLDAAETHVEAGVLRHRMGDPERAEADFFEAAHLATKVWRTAYGGTQDGAAGTNFVLGRATLTFADVVLNFGNARGDTEMTALAVALARESNRLRPLSFVAAKGLGTAIAISSQLEGDRSPKGWAQFEESKRLIDHLALVDSGNRRMQRERAAIELMIATAVSSCLQDAPCKKSLPAQQIEKVRFSTLEAIGNLRRLSGLDPDNRSLIADIGWGLKTESSLVAATGNSAAALRLLDDAIVTTRRAKVDGRDVELGVEVALMLRQKSALQRAILAKRKTGNMDEAMASLDEALAELDRLPGPSVILSNARSSIILDKEALLVKSGRTDEAKKLWDSDETRSAPARSILIDRRDRAEALILDALGIIQGPRTNGQSMTSEQWRTVVAKLELAVKEFPFKAAYWRDLSAAQGQMARLAKDKANASNGAAGAAVGRVSDADAAMIEPALREALVANSMAAMLSPEGPAMMAAWKELYRTRRDLAVFFRDQGRTEKVLALTDQDALEAAEFARLYPRSTEAQFYLADANFGLAMLRSESGSAGWEEAYRVAISHGERLAKMEPTNAERRIWIGLARFGLATELERQKRPAAAEDERVLALKACRDGLRLSKASQRREAESCLEKLAIRRVR